MGVIKVAGKLGIVCRIGPSRQDVEKNVSNIFVDDFKDAADVPDLQINIISKFKYQ